MTNVVDLAIVKVLSDLLRKAQQADISSVAVSYMSNSGERAFRFNVARGQAIRMQAAVADMLEELRSRESTKSQKEEGGGNEQG